MCITTINWPTFAIVMMFLVPFIVIIAWDAERFVHGECRWLSSVRARFTRMTSRLMVFVRSHWRMLPDGRLAWRNLNAFFPARTT